MLFVCSSCSSLIGLMHFVKCLTGWDEQTFLLLLGEWSGIVDGSITYVTIVGVHMMHIDMSM